MLFSIKKQLKALFFTLTIAASPLVFSLDVEVDAEALAQEAADRVTTPVEANYYIYEKAGTYGNYRAPGCFWTTTESTPEWRIETYYCGVAIAKKILINQVSRWYCTALIPEDHVRVTTQYDPTGQCRNRIIYSK